MKTRSFIENATSAFGRLHDAIRGVKYIEPEEYFRRNTFSTNPKGYLYFPQYIKDWLFKTYADKGDCLVMRSPLHPLYLGDSPDRPFSLIEEALDVNMIDLVNAGHFEMKPRFEVEHDPQYIQLIVSCFIITPVGNVIGVRNSKHPQIKNILSIPQGHVEGVKNINNKTLREIFKGNMKRELDEEIEFMLNGEMKSFSKCNIGFNGINYYPDFSPEHIFISYILDMRDYGINRPLNIIGKEDFNMVEVYALDELDEVGGDFLFDKYHRVIRRPLPGGEYMKHHPYTTVTHSVEGSVPTLPSIFSTHRTTPIARELSSIHSSTTELLTDRASILNK